MTRSYVSSDEITFVIVYHVLFVYHISVPITIYCGKILILFRSRGWSDGIIDITGIFFKLALQN